MRQGCFQMVTKSEMFWVSHRNSCSVTLLANLSSGQSESGVTWGRFGGIDESLSRQPRS
jgi:hypothetical protein